MDKRTKSVMAYFMLPQIIPRIRYILGTGFSTVSYYMALVFNIAQLLPNGHPYLNSANIGRYGVHHVLFQAWPNLKFDLKHTDQIIIFFCMIFAMIIIFMQFALFVTAFISPEAQASVGADFASIFITTNYTEDLAFRFLDRVFGLGGADPFFNSCVAQNVPCAAGMPADAPIPNSFHNGLHDMFEYYNTGLAIIAFLIILYYVIALTAETAKTGVPFGMRFNHAIAPIRLIIAFGLLVPITSGFNGAQLITLAMAKWGSSMATNGWITFLDEVKGTTILGDADTLVVTPQYPQVNTLVEFMFVARTCMHAYEMMTETLPLAQRINIEPYVIRADNTAAVITSYADLNAVIADTQYKNVTIRFGHLDNVNYTKYSGFVRPLCGEMEIPLQDISEPGARYVQNGYVFELLFDPATGLWEDTPNDDYAQDLVRLYIPGVPNRDVNAGLPTPAFIGDTFDWFNDIVADIVDAGVTEQITNGNWAEDFSKLGWGGAAIWYNKIAQFNGGLIASVYTLPNPVKYPEVMEAVLESKRAQNNVIAGRERFNPVLSGGYPAFDSGSENDQLSKLFYKAQTIWQSTQEANSGSSFKDAIVMMLGLQGLIDMQQNVDIHPLAQLVGVGRSLVQSAVQGFGYMVGASALGGLISMIAGGNLGESARSFIFQVMMLGFSLGFVLYYVLPFLPFLYFFIALTNWVKTIFEAMVGLPLWALSHIRIEGDGIPGPAAMNGYYLIFQIFINPILIVFGSLAGMTIFAAQVRVLHEIWGLVTSNVTGIDLDTISKVDEDKLGSIRYLRSAFDQFFYTCLYAVFVYMMGLASFKLVDSIPQHLLRWMGSSVKTFGETAEGIVGELVSKSYQVSQTATGGADAVMGQMMTRNS
ncbi:MAG: DotA/TraY family protein [Micavibrio sp.]